ncbi:MAG: DUF4912 domain-containing protein [Treponema sp.]|jgi:hypothetical protein|nr:DUF4912 domain-containing protein [Treponema sp.]
MDGCNMSRAFLEDLSTGELIRLADQHGIDIPPELDRIFIMEELLDAAGEEETGEEEALTGVLAGPAFLEPVPLPKQYNINFIEVMIRDPLWVFVFWEVKGADREFYERSPDFAGYFLRILPCKDGERRADREGAFTVPVGPEDNARYLGFPPPWNEEAGEREGPSFGKTGGIRYAVELGVYQGEEEIGLVFSQPFGFPRLFEVPCTVKDSGGIYKNPLAKLSGIEDFSLLHSKDRISRPKNRGTGVR